MIFIRPGLCSLSFRTQSSCIQGGETGDSVFGPRADPLCRCKPLQPEAVRSSPRHLRTLPRLASRLVMARFWVCVAGAGFFLAFLVLHSRFCGSPVSWVVRKGLSGVRMALLGGVATVVAWRWQALVPSVACLKACTWVQTALTL